MKLPFFQHVLTASTVTYDQADPCPMTPTYEPGLIARLLGVVLAPTCSYGVRVSKVIAYMSMRRAKNRVRLLS